MKSAKKEKPEKRRPYRVNPLDNLNDMRVFLRGVTGMHYAWYIGQQLDYTAGQVNYRLRKYGVKLREIRSGTSEFSYLTNAVLREAEQTITRQSMAILRKQFKKLG